jgi:hypothetical protein
MEKVEGSAEANQEEEEKWEALATTIKGDHDDFIGEMDWQFRMPREVSMGLLVRAGEGFLWVDDVLDEQAAAMALARTAYAQKYSEDYEL